MSFTVKNLREVDDAAASQGFSETQEARFARGDLDAEDTGISFHVVRPSKRQAFAHRHHQAEEIYVVTAGNRRVKLDEEVVEIGPMDAIRVSPDTVRAFEAGPDGLELLAFGPHHARDGEIVRDFWED